MRTTVILDDDVAARIEAEARNTGRPFKVVANEYLRAGLAQRKAAKAVSPFRVEPVSMGPLKAGHSYDNIEVLLEEIEAAQHR